MSKPIVFHETDLFRPHNDPDDHYDLVCQFALAKAGLTDLHGVLLDYPPSQAYGDPDISAVMQLCEMTGLSVPMGIGQNGDSLSHGSGLTLLKHVLEKAERPVSLFIVGSSRDISEAGKLWPSLFREKVGAIYLNAGSGTDTPRLEYNVWLDPASFAGIFMLPCPIYWMPCFDSMERENTVGRHGTYWHFQQKRLFESLPARLLNYFLSMLSRQQDTGWLSSLDKQNDPLLRDHFGEEWRNMWCTAGFLHAAGLSVTRSGDLVPLGESPSDEVFSFQPVSVSCDQDGHARWREADESETRFLFTVEDTAVYQEAMTRALIRLLSLPDYRPSPSPHVGAGRSYP